MRDRKENADAIAGIPVQPTRPTNGQVLAYEAVSHSLRFATPSGGGGAAAHVGVATLDFGAFPGASDASVVVTGEVDILSGSTVNAWLSPATTADHTADEHLLESVKIMAGNISAGVGFTIYGINTSQINEPVTPPRGGGRISTATDAGPGKQDQNNTDIGGEGTRIYGTWNVAWQWA